MLLLHPLRYAPGHLANKGPLKPVSRCLTTLQSVLLTPVIFTGLLASLWVQKCLVLILFQNRIIYMPNMPPNSSLETIADYKRQCQGIQWREEKIRAKDGTHLFLCVAKEMAKPPADQQLRQNKNTNRRCFVYILYLQGNAGSTPLRLPHLSALLSHLTHQSFHPPTTLHLTALAYRGFWKSSGRPHESGLTLDASAAYQWIKRQHHETRSDHQEGDEAVFVVWGHSIGAGIATNLVRGLKDDDQVDGIVLETPFMSTREMLGVLYPQKWLPYKHLWPFIRNHLDVYGNLGVIAEKTKDVADRPEITLVQAGNDELVPWYHAGKLEVRCREVGLSVVREKVLGAFHNEASIKTSGLLAVADAIKRAVDKRMSRL